MTSIDTGQAKHRQLAFTHRDAGARWWHRPAYIRFEMECTDEQLRILTDALEQSPAVFDMQVDGQEGDEYISHETIELLQAQNDMTKDVAAILREMQGQIAELQSRVDALDQS